MQYIDVSILKWVMTGRGNSILARHLKLVEPIIIQSLRETPLKTKATAGRKILFLTLGDWHGSTRLLAEFGRLGCECAVMSPPGFTTATTRFAAAHFPLPRHRGLALGLLAARFRLEQANRD